MTRFEDTFRTREVSLFIICFSLILFSFILFYSVLFVFLLLCTSLLVFVCYKSFVISNRSNKGIELKLIIIASSSVSIVSDYGLNDRAIEVRSPAEAKEFFL
jgi:hypothetical protein